jgi:hypothetical protein
MASIFFEVDFFIKRYREPRKRVAAGSLHIWLWTRHWGPYVKTLIMLLYRVASLSRVAALTRDRKNKLARGHCMSKPALCLRLLIDEIVQPDLLEFFQVRLPVLRDAPRILPGHERIVDTLIRQQLHDLFNFEIRRIQLV